MKKFYYLLSAAVLTFASCSNEELSNEVLPLKGTVTASIEQEVVGSRMAFNTVDNKLSWTENDAFSVFTEDNSYQYVWTQQGNSFSSTNGVPANAEVVGVAYPYVESTLVPTLSDGNLTMTLPASYSNVDEGKCALPMWGNWNEGQVTFKHMAGVLRVNLNNLPIGYNQMKITASSAIAGEFTVSVVGTDPFELETKDNGTEVVTLSFKAAANNDDDRIVYLPLPVGTYESIQVSVSNSGADEKILANWSNKTVERAKIYTANATYVIATTNEEIQNALTAVNDNNKNVHVVMTEAVSSGEFTVPEKSGSNVTLDFNNVAENASLKITSGSGSSTDSQQNIAINVTNTDANATLEINAPKSTVEIGSGKFSTVTATTATNTLIVGKDVTVDKLILKGGNVIIEKDAKVNNIENADEFSAKTYVVKKGTLTNIPNLANVVLVSNESELALRVAAEYGGTVTLEDDIILTKTLEILAEKEVELVLNSKNLTSELECTGTYSMIVNKGKFKVSGIGKISFEDLSAGGNQSWATSTIRNEGELIIDLDDEKGSLVHLGPKQFTSTTGAPACYPIDNYNGGKVTINSGTINAPKSRSLRNFYTNGEIVINGGTFNGQVWIQQGDAGTADKGTDKICSLTVKGGSFSPTGADGSSIFITNKQYDNVILNVSGGTFNTKVGCSFPDKDGVAKKIVGGIFSDSAKSNTSESLFKNGKGDSYWTSASNSGYTQYNPGN